MNVTILGSGTAIPMRGRGSPSLAVFMDNGPILFDMGPGTLGQMARLGIGPEKIEKIFLTHFHPDHTADLIHFLFACRNPEILKRRSPFSISGPPGLHKFIKALQSAYSNWLDIPSQTMQIEELSGTEQMWQDHGHYRIKTAPASHTPHSLAYRLENNAGKAVVISGDTAYCDPIIQLAKNADLLILEAAFPDDQPMEGHLTPSLAGRMAGLAGVKGLVLTHFYPECLKTDIAAQCRRTWQGELTLAEDLLQIRV
ncbi:MAG: ribonuclease Z [Deltaproteobacteria bacterium]|nr:ribonuclease Z [Deltaproteobacteria bacterium]